MHDRADSVGVALLNSREFLGLFARSSENRKPPGGGRRYVCSTRGADSSFRNETRRRRGVDVSFCLSNVHFL